MKYNITFSNQFNRELRKIKKGDPQRIKQIKEYMSEIIKNPFSTKLHIEKIKGIKKSKNLYRYQIGMSYRLKVEIEIREKHIIFLKINRRENFYS